MDDDHRHRCEVRQVLRWQAELGPQWARQWLADVVKFRGKPAADHIRRDCAQQLERGNTGNPGEWR